MVLVRYALFSGFPCYLYHPRKCKDKLARCPVDQFVSVHDPKYKMIELLTTIVIDAIVEYSTIIFTTRVIDYPIQIHRSQVYLINKIRFFIDNITSVIVAAQVHPVAYNILCNSRYFLSSVPLVRSVFTGVYQRPSIITSHA